MNKRIFADYLNKVLNNKPISIDTKKEVYELFTMYKQGEENRNFNKYFDLINEFIIDNKLNEVDTELSKSLVYKGTIIRMHHGKNSVKDKKWAAWTYDAIYLAEIEISNNSLLIISSTSLNKDSDFGINFDDFCQYLYKKGYLPDPIINYEAEVVNPIDYSRIEADVIKNTIDD